MTKTEFPLIKEQLMEQFGYVAFQLVLANVDIIGIRLRKSWETVIITYKGATKTGFMYEGGGKTQEDILAIYRDVPENYNDLDAYEKRLADKIEILLPPKHNYVFLNDMEVAKYVKPKK